MASCENKGGHATGNGIGIVAGLVAATPAAGFVGGLASVVLVVAGAVCYFAIYLKTDLATMIMQAYMVSGRSLLGFFADSSAIPGEILMMVFLSAAESNYYLIR